MIRKKKYDVLIGIDPDLEKSGVAFLRPSTRIMELSALDFAELIDYLKWLRCCQMKNNQSVLVIVEAGWLNKGNWHVKRNNSPAKAAEIGKRTGQNQGVGMMIVQMAKHIGLEVLEMKPLIKTWKGKDKKITHEELAYFTGIMGKSNQEMRDAALIAWNYANLPIKIKIK